MAKQLDERLAALEEAPKGRKLWRLLDENRQALQEYRQDLHQAYDSNPGSAWLSREGLAAIDAAEEATRNALLREDAWGPAAAQMQREYNVPFHEKWFPARQTVLKDLHFATGKNAEGFTTFRGEPGKVRKFLTELGGSGPDAHRLREQFAQYLDGAEAVARAGERDAPKAARESLEAIRRLRKNLAQSAFVNVAAERTAARGAVAGVAGAAAAGAVGLAVGGPLAGAGGVLAARSARLGTWFGAVAQKLGMFRGDAVSMAELLAKDALPDAARPAEEMAERLAGDILDGPFPTAPSARPPERRHPRPPNGVGVAGPAPEATRRSPGPSTPGHPQAGGDGSHPPQAPVRVGEAPAPRGGGARFERLERPESLRVDEAVPEGSMSPSIREGSEVPLPGELHVNETPTFPTPYRTEGAADLEARLAPHAGAQSREAARMQALTERVRPRRRRAERHRPEGAGRRHPAGGLPREARRRPEDRRAARGGYGRRRGARGPGRRPQRRGGGRAGGAAGAGSGASRAPRAGVVVLGGRARPARPLGRWRSWGSKPVNPSPTC